MEHLAVVCGLEQRAQRFYTERHYGRRSRCHRYVRRDIEVCNFPVIDSHAELRDLRRAIIGGEAGKTDGPNLGRRVRHLYETLHTSGGGQRFSSEPILPSLDPANKRVKQRVRRRTIRC